ncbi:hypothetical protein SDC9_43709 [bioreactor metagenome]|uniref:Uncharacterized protein n=1 Tax=bioreactor metagenome TaxID=1076179 RepID=A0A644W1R3_9ZZZZ
MNPALFVEYLGFDPIYDKGTDMMSPVHQAPLVGEGGSVYLGAHLREQGQKPGVLRQGGDGREFPYHCFIFEADYVIIVLDLIKKFLK